MADEWDEKARTEARDFLRSYSGSVVAQPTYSIMLYGLTAVILKARTEAYQRGQESTDAFKAGVEAAAKDAEECGWWECADRLRALAQQAGGKGEG